MTAMDFYKKYNLPHPNLLPEVTHEQYAKNVKFEVVTLHAPANVKYTTGTAQANQASSNIPSLYTY